jgi:hypothetical protein
MVIVKESISFERGKDPKESLGIGIFAVHYFSSLEQAENFILSALPTILKLKQIPEDIIKSNNSYINDKYHKDLYPYLKKYIDRKYIELFELVKKLHYTLKERGFKDK